MRNDKFGAFLMKCSILLIGLSVIHHAMAQDAATPYPEMAPVDQYLMADRKAEIALARSAAPDSISRDATILVLGRKGYETAAEGKNGFVCVVGRSWTGPFDWPEFWSPKIRAADCLNPQAARSIVPIYELRAKMAMAGRSKAEMLSALKAAYANKQLPDLENGAMDYMMSKSSYLTDEGLTTCRISCSTPWSKTQAIGVPALQVRPSCPAPTGSSLRKTNPNRKDCRRFLCSWSQPPLGPMERLRVCIITETLPCPTQAQNRRITK